MGKPAYPLRTKLIAFAAAGLIACGLAPFAAYAVDGESVAGPLAGPGYEDDAQGASPNSTLSSDGEGAILASSLASNGASIISADVMLDSADPVVGSFTVDGLTYAVGPDGLALVAADASAVSDGAIVVPATVAYDDTTYPVTAIGPYAFYLSGATDVALPDSIASVDGRAFRSSDVERVEVDQANPDIASFDGALYNADLTSLLLIPEGRAGAVLLPCEAEVVEPSVFSHCSLVDAISVGEGGAAFASWEGLLYSADGTTLLRVPAGATDITIRDGCTTIAAGAMEGCVKLERINAPASVTSISPDVFTSIPTVSLPAQLALQDESGDSVGDEGEAEVSPRRVVASSQGLEAPDVLPDLGSTSASPSSEASDSAPQLTAMVALSSADDDLPEVDPSSIEVFLPEGADSALWTKLGVSIASSANVQGGGVSYANVGTASINPNGGVFSWANGRADPFNTLPSGSSVFTVACKGTNWALHASDVAYKKGDALFAYYSDDTNPPYHVIISRTGYHHVRWTGTVDGTPFQLEKDLAGLASQGNLVAAPQWAVNTYTISFDANGGQGAVPNGVTATYGQACSIEEPALTRLGFTLDGWSTSPGGAKEYERCGPFLNVTSDYEGAVTLYAHWERTSMDLSFDTSSEPGDADYPGEAKPDQTITSDQLSAGEQVPIEDPKRPGYVFEGWVIPTEDGTEAVDQDLVYQGDDGKWYVDASKLPDYADSDGKVELTARWTAALSVDAPISATFMYDLSAWDGTEARDAYVEGSSTVKNRSAVPIRVSGLESKAGDAAGVLKRGDGTTLADAGATDEPKVLSVFPTTSAVTGTEGDAKAPASDDVADDLAHKVDMALSDVKLEAAFDKGAWAVDAATVGDNGVTVSTGDLKLGYRLNLGDATGVTLDQDALLAITGEPEGTDASAPAAIADLTYCFALEGPRPTGAKSDPLWVEVTDPEVGSVGIYGLSDIKAAADDFSSRVDPATDPNDWDSIYSQIAGSPYAKLFVELRDGKAPFKAKLSNGSYLDMLIIGICQDNRTDGRKAGLTLQSADCYTKAVMNGTSERAGIRGWAYPQPLRTAINRYFDESLNKEIAAITKMHQKTGGKTASYLQTSEERVFIPSVFEIYGETQTARNEAEAYLPSNQKFRYQIYDSHQSRQKMFQGSPVQWWLRSAGPDNETRFDIVDVTVLTSQRSVTSAKMGVAPAFCL